MEGSERKVVAVVTIGFGRWSVFANLNSFDRSNHRKIIIKLFSGPIGY